MLVRLLCLGTLVQFVVLTLVGWQVTTGFEITEYRWWQWLLACLVEVGSLPPDILWPLRLSLGISIAALVMGGIAINRVGSRTVHGGFGNDTLHGTARWARWRDVVQAGLAGRAGVIVGGVRRWWQTRTLQHNGPEHIMAFAPTRSGKGVGLVIPTLLTWEHSVIVLDIKGENHALTSGYRASLGQSIIRFDPAAESGSHRFNVLAEVRTGTDQELADCQNIAMMLIDPKGKGLEDFWQKGGYMWMTAVLIHVIYVVRDSEDRQATLRDVAQFMSNTPEVDMFEAMMTHDHGRASVNDMVAGQAQSMKNRHDGERSGLMSTAIVELALYADPIVSKNISGSDFCIADLMDSEMPLSLYIVVPPAEIDRLRPLLRAMFNLMLRRLLPDMGFEDGTLKKPHKHRLLLMMDEFTSIGKMEIFEQALAYMAGYGLKGFLIVQDLAQLRKAYGREEAITGNCHIRIAYAPAKLETARELSEMIGKTTVVQRKRSRSTKAGAVAGSISESVSETHRPLLTPDECMRLRGMHKTPKGAVKRAGDMVILPAGFNPIFGRQVLYFKDKTLLARAAMPPSRVISKDRNMQRRAHVGHGLPAFDEIYARQSMENDDE